VPVTQYGYRQISLFNLANFLFLAQKKITKPVGFNQLGWNRRNPFNFKKWIVAFVTSFDSHYLKGKLYYDTRYSMTTMGIL